MQDLVMIWDLAGSCRNIFQSFEGLTKILHDKILKNLIKILPGTSSKILANIGAYNILHEYKQDFIRLSKI